MNRWKASATHLTISAVVAAIVCGAMLELWYPPPYFTAMGGTTLLMLIVGCDVVLGPLITLIIFKSGKRGLKVDLAVIGCVQLAALGYGLYTIFIARPVFTVFVIDRFDVVAAADIRPEDLAAATSPEFATFPLTGPRIVGARLAADTDVQQAITLNALRGGADVKQLPRLYVPYAAVAADAGRHAKPLAALASRGPDVAAMLRKIADKAGKDLGNLGYVPLSARNQSMSVILDVRTGEIAGMVPVTPW